MSNIVISSNPKDQQKIKNALVEIVNSMTRIDAEKDNIKAVLDVLKDEQDIPPAISRKTATLIHKQTKADNDALQDDIDTLYEIATR